MNIFYTYILLDPRKFYEPFYVGKGKNNRCQDHISSKRIGKNKLKNGVIQKIRNAGLDIGVLKWKENISEEEAFDLEIELIKRFGRRNNGTGILTNLTDGGEGVSGMVFTDGQREKRCQKNRGCGNPMFGKNHTDAVKDKISKDAKERYSKNSLAWTTNNPRSSTVTDGVNIYPSLSEAARQLKIGRQAINGKIKRGEMWIIGERKKDWEVKPKRVSYKKTAQQRENISKAKILFHKNISNDWLISRAARDPRCKPISINGIDYVSQNQAIKTLKISYSKFKKMI